MKKLLLLWVAATLLPAGGALAVDTMAKHAFLMDADTHTVLLNKEGDVKMHPSSMSKMMTIYLLFDRLKSGRVKLEDTFKVSEKAWSTQGSKMFVELNNEIPVETLIHGILTQSGNDACVVVAEGISGSEEAFARELNKKAQEIGLTGSHFTNATGLPDEEHLMSARDLAILSERLIKDFPEYYGYFAQPEFTYHNIRQFNRNRLLGTVGVDGLKTGHTEDAGYGITLSAKQGDRRLILVLNGLASDNDRVKEGDRLLRYGFREFENKTIAKKGEAIADANVWFGKAPTVPLVAAEDVTVTLPVNAVNVTSFILKYNGPLPAPVEQGVHVADLVIKTNGLQDMVVPLNAGQDVAKLSGFGRMVATVKHYLLNR
jgi:serine-type D-Ala-D-Ala carboxypeptidase (penicillin-binding protein 5/6)